MKYLIAISLFLCSCCSQNFNNKIYERQLKQIEWYKKRDARIDSLRMDYIRRHINDSANTN